MRRTDSGKKWMGWKVGFVSRLPEFPPEVALIWFKDEFNVQSD